VCLLVVFVLCLVVVFLSCSCSSRPVFDCSFVRAHHADHSVNSHQLTSLWCACWNIRCLFVCLIVCLFLLVCLFVCLAFAVIQNPDIGTVINSKKTPTHSSKNQLFAKHISITHEQTITQTSNCNSNKMTTQIAITIATAITITTTIPITITTTTNASKQSNKPSSKQVNKQANKLCLV